MISFVLVYFAVQVCCSWVSGGSQLVNQPPHVYGNWNWNITFHYQSQNPDEVGHLDFDIDQTRFNLDLGTADKNFTMQFNFILQSGDPLTDCVLHIVAERAGDYFAWTDMTLTYTFRDRPADMNSTVPLGPLVAKTDRKQKFFTRLGDVYECRSVIPVLFGKDATLRLFAMDFQAFKAVANASDNLDREVCPRDFKSNVPIAALTGSMLLVVALTVAGFIGVNAYLKYRKNKTN